MIKTTIQEKQGKGLALFANEHIAKGTIVFFFGNKDTKVITLEEYVNLVHQGDRNAIRTGCRITKDSFVIYNSDKPNPCEYINHSFSPSLLYYYGMCIASRDIEIGDELTLDYSYIVSDEAFESFVDCETGKAIKGISYNTYDKKSIEQLKELIT
jgi:hypothetical protein